MTLQWMCQEPGWVGCKSKESAITFQRGGGCRSHERTDSEHHTRVLTAATSFTFPWVSLQLNVCKVLQVRNQTHFSDCCIHSPKMYFTASRKCICSNVWWLVQGNQRKCCFWGVMMGIRALCNGKEFSAQLSDSWHCTKLFYSMTWNLHSAGTLLYMSHIQKEHSGFYRTLPWNTAFPSGWGLNSYITCPPLELKALVLPDSLSISSCRACRLT